MDGYEIFRGHRLLKLFNHMVLRYPRMVFYFWGLTSFGLSV